MSEPQKEPLAEGSLLSHLLELRNRLARSAIAVVVLFIPCAIFQNTLYAFFATPLLQQLPPGTSMIATSLTAPFLVPLKLAFFTAIFLAMPYMLYQAWAFVAPGLYRYEKRFAIPLLISSAILFYAGIAFAFFVVYPLMFAFITSTAPVGVAFMPDITSYLDFALWLSLAFGVAFEIPVAAVLLVLTELVRLEKLKENRGYVILGIFIVAAFLTPADAISQSLMAVPMCLLYEAGILLSRILWKEKLARQRSQQQKQCAST